MTREKSTVIRYHAMDNLRAVAMLAGIIFHASLAYITLPVDTGVKDMQQNAFFDILGLLLHTVRMPIFFVIAGFFGALLFQLRGKQAFIQHKIKRILLPFLLSWIIAIPLLYSLIFVASFISGKEFNSLQEMFLRLGNFFKSGEFLMQNQLMYLWFLFYLLFFYLLQITLQNIWKKVETEKRMMQWNKLAKGFLFSRGRILLLIVPTVFALYLMSFWTIDTPMMAIPEPKFLAYYGLFYLFGYQLYGNKERLEELAKNCWTNLSLGALIALPVHLFFLLSYGFNPDMQTAATRFITLLFLALTTWLMLLAIFGLFLRYFNKQSPRMRYISDSSYWMYLGHLPVVMALQIALLPLELPALLKFLIVTVVTYLILLIMYESMIRYTAVGTLLNGKKKRETSIKKKLVRLVLSNK